MVVYKEQLSTAWISITVLSMRLTLFLIDEARTPLIISGQSGKSTKLV